jgi:biopolymer transport protein ExbD
MEAIEDSGSKISKSDVKGRPGKISTRVDMTPMVDLGFLLITFFMLATTMTKPTAMSVFFPDKQTDDKNAIKASGVLTLFLGAHDDIYYLDGISAEDDKALSSLRTTQPGLNLRNVIFAAQRRLGAKNHPFTEGNELIVVIKPTAVSNYKNMVDAMDEMAITKSKRYALVDELTDSERQLLGEKIIPE